MLLAKFPVPEPSIVLLSAVVGFIEVLQHTPRAVTGVFPSKVIFPPLIAVKPPILLIAVVVSVGSRKGGEAVLPPEFIQEIPLYTFNSPFNSQFVHHTTRPVAGLTMASRWVAVIRGGKKPWFAELTSKRADAAGLIVPMPTLCPCVILMNNRDAMAKNNFLIIVQLMIDNDRSGETISIGKCNILINCFMAGEVMLQYKL